MGAYILKVKHRQIGLLIFLLLVSFLLAYSLVLVFLSNLPVFTIMNVCTFFGLVLTLSQHHIAIVPILHFVSVVYYFNNGVYALAHYKSRYLDLFSGYE